MKSCGGADIELRSQRVHAGKIQRVHEDVFHYWYVSINIRLHFKQFVKYLTVNTVFTFAVIYNMENNFQGHEIPISIKTSFGYVNVLNLSSTHCNLLLS